MLIDWAERDNYYVVLYPENRSGPLAELHRIEHFQGAPHVIWSYRPSKQDGMNAERKEYFARYFRTTEITIYVPRSLWC